MKKQQALLVKTVKMHSRIRYDLYRTWTSAAAACIPTVTVHCRQRRHAAASSIDEAACP
ncbi:MAG: hypothetical protein MR568_03135 [Eisenbergiella massiliensis]|nr:hypothetical protein [Eisenbergiella massiliensis]